MDPIKTAPKSHDVQNFVDDSNNLIAFKNSKGIQEYLQKYSNLMIEYYNSNMLKINPDKHQFMISGKPKLLEDTKNISFMGENLVIKQKDSLKIQ